MLNPAAMPYWSGRVKQEQPKPSTRSYDDLLQKPCPIAGPTMPASRPKKLCYYADTDPAMADELARLARGVVFDTHGIETEFSIKDVISFATRTGQVVASEISIGILSKTKFLIVLPKGMAPETFIQATTPELWEKGFSFQPWSLLDEGRLVLPEYKVLLELKGLPPHFHREQLIARAMGLFGTYLGSIPAADPADISSWKVVVAVDRLERIPDEVGINVGAIEFLIQVSTCNWLRAPLYTTADLPKIPQKFSKPPKPAPGHLYYDPEPFVISRSALMQLCKGADIASLPEEVQAFLAASPEASVIPDMPAASWLSDLALPEDGCTNGPGNMAIMVDAADMVEAVDAAGQLSEVAPDLHHSSQLSSPQSIPRSQSKTSTDKPKTLMVTTADPKQKAKGLHKAARSQTIQTPVQILRRSPAKRTPVAAPLIPTRSSGREGSDLQRLDTRAKRQWVRRGDADTSKGKQAGATKATASGQTGKTGPASSRFNQGRPKGKDKLIAEAVRPKPRAFKKALPVQSNVAQPRAKGPMDKAVIASTSDGLIQVDVQYSHVAALGMGCGLPTERVSEALDEDNLQRRLSSPPEASLPEMDLDQEGPDVTFDLDSDDNLDSEEDVEL